MDVYSLWIYDIIDYRMDYELKVGSLSSFGSFKYQRNGTFTVEDQTMSAHWYRATLGMIMILHQTKIQTGMENFTKMY